MMQSAQDGQAENATNGLDNTRYGARLSEQNAETSRQRRPSNPCWQAGGRAGWPSAQSRDRILFVVTADHSMISWAGNEQ